MSKRIVVADDDDDIRGLIVFTLERRGYDVIEARNGGEALALVREHAPALVVLDVMMPELTGPEVATAIRRSDANADVPIVMLSAKGQTYEIDEGLASGADRYLVKPFAPRELADVVATLLGITTP